ncbi:MAG: DUF433 domain-containing protein [Chloroflexota bacterium]
MALAERAPYSRIVRDPRVHGGEPTVRGTRVPVRVIVVAWRGEPEMPAMLQAYPRLTEADIVEALAFYREHQAEIDARIEAQLTEG